MWRLLAGCAAPTSLTTSRPLPQVEGCRPAFALDLPAPAAGDGRDARLAWSPDGRSLAVAVAGRVWRLDGDDGSVLAERALPEAVVRALAWSPDGAVVYVAEQSADAFVYALDGATLEERARYRVADDVGTSPPPRADDPWGVYQLPAAYHLAPRPDGLVVVGAHGWDTPGGRRNASRVVHLDRGLRPVAAWPAAGAADAVFGATAASGDALAVAVRRSAAGPAPAGLPIDGVQLLSLPALEPTGTVALERLPGYDAVFVWDALALGPHGLALGTGDGRLATAGREGLVVVPYATPVATTALPVAASVGTLRAAGDEVFTLTSRSWSPGSADGAQIPETLHPEERAVAAWSWTAAGLGARWMWRGPYELAGLDVGAGGLIVAAGPRDDGRADLFGLLRFGRDGGAPVVCPTPGAAVAPALRDDGRAAIVEVPVTLDGVRTGVHRVSAWY